MDERILNCVYAAIDEANEDRTDLPPLEKSPDTPLHGTAADLDSLGLINFLVATEEGIEREFGLALRLSDIRSLEKKPNPLASVGAFAKHVETLLDEQRR